MGICFSGSRAYNSPKLALTEISSAHAHEVSGRLTVKPLGGWPGLNRRVFHPRGSRVGLEVIFLLSFRNDLVPNTPLLGPRSGFFPAVGAPLSAPPNSLHKRVIER